MLVVCLAGEFHLSEVVDKASVSLVNLTDHVCESKSYMLLLEECTCLHGASRYSFTV